MAEAGDGSGHTPLTPEWTPAPRASHYPWQGDRPAAAPSLDKTRSQAVARIADSTAPQQ